MGAPGCPYSTQEPPPPPKKKGWLLGPPSLFVAARVGHFLSSSPFSPALSLPSSFPRTRCAPAPGGLGPILPVFRSAATKVWQLSPVPVPPLPKKELQPTTSQPPRGRKPPPGQAAGVSIKSSTVFGVILKLNPSSCGENVNRVLLGARQPATDGAKASPSSIAPLPASPHGREGERSGARRAGGREPGQNLGKNLPNSRCFSQAGGPRWQDGEGGGHGQPCVAERLQEDAGAVRGCQDRSSPLWDDPAFFPLRFSSSPASSQVIFLPGKETFWEPRLADILPRPFSL